VAGGDGEGVDGGGDGGSVVGWRLDGVLCGGGGGGGDGVCVVEVAGGDGEGVDGGGDGGSVVGWRLDGVLCGGGGGGGDGVCVVEVVFVGCVGRDVSGDGGFDSGFVGGAVRVVAIAVEIVVVAAAAVFTLEDKDQATREIHSSHVRVWSSPWSSLCLCWCLLLLIGGADRQLTHPNEVNALRNIQRSLTDPNRNLHNWNRGDPCNSKWTGVYCHNRTMDDGYLHVKELFLLNRNLSGSLSPQLGQLSYLEILDFMWNKITGSIPKVIGNITTLKLLLLNGNQLTGSLPDEIGFLPILDRIQIDENKISVSIPTSFANLSNAKHFHMNNNSLSGQIPPQLSRLPELVCLILDNNNLLGSLPPELSEMPKLQILLHWNHNRTYRSHDFVSVQRMLIYEFMSNGTLRDHLPGKTKLPLSFTMRVKIALDSAKGILYLHTEANPPIFHRDIKSTNILLDRKFIAKVADFGLSRLAPVPELEGGIPSYVSTVVKGTPGYLDPEYFLTYKLTDKSDVYSLGVVFLELLTGMHPISHGKNIVREVNIAYRSSMIFSVIDERMGSYPFECVEKFIKLALKCCQDETDSRPSVAEVVRELENIWLMIPDSDTKIFESIDIDPEKDITPPSSSNKLMHSHVSQDISSSDLVSGVIPTITPR
ncbi:probable LRR receptor-like serine/threonine-protein kinase At1g06840, partial [Olea europaea var. sylvestris]|uniref:probable LRR receptor-like serine/threonine-protein kinase At1g06840 n=1 Tax=Olea europaea var. sylvestris TaxID=158386 RepID=UPI000C1D7829